MKIVIETIPHAEQRYNTVGDYWMGPDGTIQVRVSQLGAESMEFLVALHELVELQLCRHRNIPWAAIDEFDMNWQPGGGVEEPGDDMMAPYFAEHQAAMGIETTMSAFMGVNWVEYGRRVAALTDTPEVKDGQ